MLRRDEHMDISKKDLLKETGISYGQLYRWKREGLIPEAWFQKKASFTGQETYFPKEEILKRVKAIQQLKDTYSLEELARLLSPEVSNRLFMEEDLEKFEEIELLVATTFMDELEKDEFTFLEVLVMIAFSDFQKKVKMDCSEMQSMIHHVIVALGHIHSINYLLLILKIHDTYMSMLQAENTLIFLDSRMTIIKEIRLQEISNNIKVKYKHTFQFTFDEEVS